MNKNIHKHFLLLSLIICSGIASAQRMKSVSDIKWTGHDTGIGSVLENKGYYKSKHLGEGYIFYDDGTFVLTDKVPGDTIVYHYGLWPPGGYYDNELDRWDLGATGVYRIDGDVIYVNMYHRVGFYFSNKIRFHLYTEMYKLKFTILDSTTLLWNEERMVDKEVLFPRIINDTLYFWRNDELPPPNTNMKKKKWLWEKEAWKIEKRKRQGRHDK